MNTRNKLALLRSVAAPRAIIGSVLAMRRDLKSNVDIAAGANPAARTNGTSTGAAVDLQGYDSAFAAFQSGAWTDGTHTPGLFESTDGTTFTAVGTADLQGSFTAVAGTAGQNAVQRVGYLGSKRYIQGQIVTAGATTGALSGMTIVRSSARIKPLA